MSLLESIIEIDEASVGVKKRVRNAGKKVQRRFKFSKNKNRSFNNATKKSKVLTKAQRREISRKQKIAARKRKSSKSIAKVKRNISNRKRKALNF